MIPEDARHLVGRRVVVRTRLPTAGGEPQRYSDVLGRLRDATPAGLVVVRSGGEAVTIGYDTVHRMKAVPPPPTRVTDGDVVALQAIAGTGWRAIETEPLGGWLLRAAGGFTGRANSVLAARGPGPGPDLAPDHDLAPDLDLDDAIARAEAWYAARDRPAWFQIPLPTRADLDAELDRRGYTLAMRQAVVLTADLPLDASAATDTAAGLPPVRFDPEPSAAWLDVYSPDGVPAAGLRVLTGHPRVVFGSCVEGGRTVAVVRAAVDDGWVGISALAVSPDQRRRGLARHLLTAALDRAVSQGGAGRAYLQVEPGNTGALALYERLGFTHHHRYHYRARP